MDNLSENNVLKCTSHPNEFSTFIKINQLNKSDKILYCEICIEEDNSFASKNFLNIKSILKSNQFIQKWPPLDNKVLEQIIQVHSNIENNKNMEQEIVKFFDELKNEILLKIDYCQKSLINLASEINLQNKNIFEKFKDIQSISSIDNMKNIVINSQLNQKEKESELRQFIDNAHNQKESNKQQIKNILKENNLYNQKISFENSEANKILILSQIDNLKFFGLNYENEKQGMRLMKPINQNNKIEDILQQLYVLNAQYDEKTTTNQTKISKLYNNQIEINCKSGGGQRLFSNIIIEENKKYLFKFKIQINSFQDQFLRIGLINDLHKDNQDFIQLKQKQVFYSTLLFQKGCQKVKVEENDFIFKEQVNEDNDVRDLELRVDLYNEILDIIFSNHYKLSIKDELKLNLLSNSHRLYLFLNNEISITITNAFVCEEFDN